MADSYHHGNLRRNLLDSAAKHAATSGPESLSLRSLAAEEGVSHAAPRHHFGSREGLITALATEGYALLADSLNRARARESENAKDAHLEVGIAYVQFATDHPGHFAVMFNPDLVLADDVELIAAQQRAFGLLTASAGDLQQPDQAAATLAGWALMHGLVHLTRSGALEASHVASVLGTASTTELARRVGRMLYSPPEGPQ